MNSNNSQKKYFPGTGKFDKINSTFRSKIIFNSTQKVPHLDGYSKGLLQPKEPDDKIYMLQNWIIRLVNNGYLSSFKTLRIEFYIKSFLDNTDELFLILEPDRYSIHVEKYLLNERLNKFLTRLYQQLKSGKIITKELVDQKLRFEEEEIFSIQKKRFQSEDELRTYCISKIKEGNAEGMVKNFFYKYKSRHLSA